MISEGTIEFEGETIHYKWYRNGRLPKGGPIEGYQCCIEANYDGPISIEDNGNGLEYAKNLLKNEISNRKSKRVK